MTAENKAPGIFETINARFLSPEKVAKSFVVSDHFEKLTRSSHSLVVGPRGSGKTTLLKMLQVPALSVWEHPDADRYRKLIDYTGVFIPTDIVWAKQISSLGEKYLSAEQSELFANAIFTTHILRELIGAMQYRLTTSDKANAPIHRSISCTDEQESRLVKGIAEHWDVRPNIYSMFSLRQALTRRIGDIYRVVSSGRFLDPSERNRRIADVSYLHINFLQATESAIEIFADLFGDINQRWALLFDELELAPNYLVKYLISALRSSDQRILFKLSFSPFNENIDILHNAVAAMPRHDFEYIQLWYPNKDDGMSFSFDLVSSLLRNRNLEGVNLNQILGQSKYEGDKSFEKKKGAYGGGSRQVQLLRRLYKNDESFRRYIDHNCINLDQLDILGENERARVARKIFGIALVRDAYRSPDKFRTKGYDARRRSRKAYPDIYAGAKAILEILEGNPRWIIGVIGPLLDLYRKTGKRIDASRQLDEVRKAFYQFKALLSALPCDVAPKGKPPKSVMSILDIIGDYFRKTVILDRFQPEPHGSFIVDKNTTKEFEKSLALALNAGAIVYIPGNTSQLVIDSLVNRRFRISYLMAPNYQIPIQLMREVALSQALRGDKVEQLTLFESARSNENDSEHFNRTAAYR